MPKQTSVTRDAYPHIRKARTEDLSRIAEILVFNNRINFFPIFQDEVFSFREMQVASLMRQYQLDPDRLFNTYVYDDGILRGLLQVEENEIIKLYVDPFFQSRGIGNALIQFAIDYVQADHLWALEKNENALRFYEQHGFHTTTKRKLEEGTNEYLIQLVRS